MEKMAIVVFKPFKNSILALIILISFSLCGCRQGNEIYVWNYSSLPRHNEIVEVVIEPNSDLDSPFVILDNHGEEVPYQFTHDGKLLFPASVEANATAVYKIRKGQPMPVDTLLAYTFRPDCQDDLAWENEHSGYRLYGPSYKDGGGNVHGYDLWCKRMPYPIVKRFYDLDHGEEQISYHKDHGEGFDGYTVGPTLGAGCNALLFGDSLIYPTAYRNYEILDSGPLRLTIRFEIDPVMLDSVPVKEVRTISLNRGANFNRVSTIYNGIKDSISAVAGIVVHADNPDGYNIDNRLNTVSVVDLSDDVAAGNGEIYIAAIIPSATDSYFKAIDTPVANAIGQAMLAKRIAPTDTLVYYFGSAWSKGSVPTAHEWRQIVETEAQKLRQPLKATFR